MALALLTACGGGPTEEQKVLAQISQEKGVQVTNNAELRAVAERNLNEDLNAKIKILGYAGAFNFHTDRLEGDLVITITARYDYKDTLLSDVLNKIYNYEDYNASVKQDGNWSNIGVVVQSNNEQSYIGISIRIKGKSKKFSPFSPERGCKAALRGLFCV